MPQRSKRFQAARWAMRGGNPLTEALLVKEIQAEFAVKLPFCNGRPFRVDVPLNPDNRRITLRKILDVCKGEIAGHLLLERHAGRRRVLGADNLGINLEF